MFVTLYYMYMSWLIFIVNVQIRRKPSYLDVKIKPRNENGTPSIVSPPRPHSPANSLPYVNVTDDKSSNQLSAYKWYVVMALSLEIRFCSVMNHWLKPFIDNAYIVLLLWFNHYKILFYQIYHWKCCKLVIKAIKLKAMCQKFFAFFYLIPWWYVYF